MATVSHDVDIIGTVTMARVRRPLMALVMEDGREIEAVFAPEQEGIITTALKEHRNARVRIRGQGFCTPEGKVQRIIRIDHISLLPTDESSDPLRGPWIGQTRPIWEVAMEIGASVPEQEWAKVPTDASKNLDHYLYGAPKDEE